MSGPATTVAARIGVDQTIRGGARDGLDVHANATRRASRTSRGTAYDNAGAGTTANAVGASPNALTGTAQSGQWCGCWAGSDCPGPPSAFTSLVPLAEHTSIQPERAPAPASRANDGAADASSKARQAIQDVNSFDATGDFMPTGITDRVVWRNTQKPMGNRPMVSRKYPLARDLSGRGST